MTSKLTLMCKTSKVIHLVKIRGRLWEWLMLWKDTRHGERVMVHRRQDALSLVL